MTISIDPNESKTISPGGSQKVTAKLWEGKADHGTLVDNTSVVISAASISSLGFTKPSLTGTSDLKFDVTVACSDGYTKKFSGQTINGSAAYEAGKSAMTVAISPDKDQTISPGGSQRVYAQLLDKGTLSTSTSVLVSAASVTGVSFGAPSLAGTSDLKFDVTVTYSNNGNKKFEGKTINGSAAYNAGKSATALAISPSTNTTLGYGESKTVTAQIKDGNTELKKTSVVITAPAKPTIVLGITPGSKTLNYGEAQTVTATVKENDVKIKEGSITITAPAAPPTVTGVSFGAPSLSGTSDLKFSVSVTYSDGTSVSLGEKSINGSASYKAGQDSMGLSINGTTVSVAVSETKSATASVGSSHRIQSDGSVSLTPGQTFKGAPGTYYKNPRIVADHWINWT